MSTSVTPAAMFSPKGMLPILKRLSARINHQMKLGNDCLGRVHDNLERYGEMPSNVPYVTEQVAKAVSHITNVFACLTAMQEFANCNLPQDCQLDEVIKWAHEFSPEDAAALKGGA